MRRLALILSVTLLFSPSYILCFWIVFQGHMHNIYVNTVCAVYIIVMLIFSVFGIRFHSVVGYHSRFWFLRPGFESRWNLFSLVKNIFPYNVKFVFLRIVFRNRDFNTLIFTVVVYIGMCAAFWILWATLYQLCYLNVVASMGSILNAVY